MNTLKPLILVTTTMVFQLPDSSLNSRDGRNRRRFSSRSDKPKAVWVMP
jgi:hypothetical protein